MSESKISDLMVLSSAAGYYHGHLYLEGEEGKGGWWLPYDRESGYYPSYEAALRELVWALDDEALIRAAKKAYEGVWSAEAASGSDGIARRKEANARLDVYAKEARARGIPHEAYFVSMFPE